MEDKIFLNQICEWIELADKKAREYELEKQNKFQEECPYPEIIQIFEKIRDVLVERGWENEASHCRQQISFYKEKWENDKRLREVELEKAKKKEMFENLHTIKEIDSIEAVIESLNKEEELLNYEEQKEREEAEIEEIFQLISKADKLEQTYEAQKKMGQLLSVECPYPQILNLYQQAKNRFEAANWQSQANRLNESIEHYKEKIQQDKILRFYEKKKITQTLDNQEKPYKLNCHD
ncbi:MAG: hypothetical protein ACTSR8_18420 [Promethearchaeota archaeon]